MYDYNTEHVTTILTTLHLILLHCSHYKVDLSPCNNLKQCTIPSIFTLKSTVCVTTRINT